MIKAIAIDGPAGAGKSTVAKLVAKSLGYLYIDTGAMYRAVAWKASQLGVAFDDEKGLTAIAKTCDIRLVNRPDGYKVFCDGVDVSEEIRRPEIGKAASPVSAVLGVRQALVDKQKLMGEKGGVVMDGRDIGTKVLPDAACKIFLTASAGERAQRRVLELQNKGIEISYEEVLKEITERDERDSTRAHSPLMQADGAVLIDSTQYTIEQVVSQILSLARQRIQGL